MPTAKKQHRFCGREFTTQEISLIQEVVTTCAGISCTELAHTICELLNWTRANGRLKATECLELLTQLDRQGILVLPARKTLGSVKPQKSIRPAGAAGFCGELTGSVEQFTPIDVELVQSPEQRLLFQELVSRYHYLEYARPFGARLQYLCYVSRPHRQVVGCMQFSSPAWRMKPRDQWIGWDDVETLVDSRRFYGGCYRAANFIVLGPTSGRGRVDRSHQRHGAAIKTVMVYPLVKNATARLSQGLGR